jgi:hypothetical protein
MSQFCGLSLAASRNRCGSVRLDTCAALAIRSKRPFLVETPPNSFKQIADWVSCQRAMMERTGRLPLNDSAKRLVRETGRERFNGFSR